jgi:hypothetical protein
MASLCSAELRRLIRMRVAGATKDELRVAQGLFRGKRVGALDRVGDAEAQFGSYDKLTKSREFRFSRTKT